jgi:hypothetical protein
MTRGPNKDFFAPGPASFQLCHWCKGKVMNCKEIFVTPTFVILVILAVYSSTWCNPCLIKKNKVCILRTKKLIKKLFTLVYVVTWCYPWRTFFSFYKTLTTFYPWCIICKLLQINSCWNEWIPQAQWEHERSIHNKRYLPNNCPFQSPSYQRQKHSRCLQTSPCMLSLYFPMLRCTITKPLCTRTSFKDFYMHVTFNVL